MIAALDVRVADPTIDRIRAGGPLARSGKLLW